MPNHPQVTISYSGSTAEVDEQLAPLMVALWRQGYVTVESCQAQETTRMSDPAGLDVAAAWIAFGNPDDAERFAEVVSGISGEARVEPIEMLLPLGTREEDRARYAQGATAVAFPSTTIGAVTDAIAASQVGSGRARRHRAS